MVSVDICTINDAGNLFDAASLGALAALQDVKFPTYDGKKVDYKAKTDKKLGIVKHPLSVTVLKIGDHFLVDPHFEEEKVYDGRLSVAVEEDGTLCAMQKGGEAPLSVEEVVAMIDIATEKTQELRKFL